MTGQICDRLVLDGETYAVVSTLGGALFSPADHGWSPRPLHTGAWRGYIADFRVDDARRLLLDGLQIALADPPGGTAEPPVLAGHAPVEADRGRYRFADLALPTRYCGTVLLGRDAIPAEYVHMGYPEPRAFAVLRELSVDGGTVTAVADRSAEAAAERRTPRGAPPVPPPAH